MTRTADDFLEHYGVKGMRWGVRKAEKAQSQADRARKVATARPTRGNVRLAERRERRANKKWDKVDKKWEKSIYTMKGAVAVHNETASRVNAGLDVLNNDPKYKDTQPLNQGNDSQLRKDYISAYEALTSKSYSDAVRKVHGSSPSGKKEAVYIEDDFLGDRIEVRSKNVAHAEDDEPDLVIRLKRGADGLFVEANMAELGELEHIDRAGHFLEHYGVKGMRWGVRRNREAVEVTPKTAPGRKVKASGGKYHTPSEDAIKAAVIRQQAKKSTTDSLSNQELRELVNRMQLEQQYASLNQNNVGIGKQIARVIFGQVGDNEVRGLQDYASDTRGKTTIDKNGNRRNDPQTSFAVKVGVAGAKTVVGANGGKKK